MVGTLTDAELLGSPFARRLGRASWFLSAWAYLIAAYCIFGFLWVLWAFIRSRPAGIALVTGPLEALAAGPFFGIVGLLISFPTVVMAPVYLVVLRRVPTGWGRWLRRLAAVTLAPLVLGAPTFVLWGLPASSDDWFFVRCLVGVLLLYGLIVPFPRGTNRSDAEPASPVTAD